MESNSVEIVEEDGKEYFQLPDGRAIRIPDSTDSTLFPSEEEKEKMKKGLEIYFDNRDRLERDYYGKIAVIRSKGNIEIANSLSEANDEKPYLTILKVGSIAFGRRPR